VFWRGCGEIRTYSSTYLPIYLPTYLLIYLLTYLLTYLLIHWAESFLVKLTGFQLVKEFPAFYVTWMFITALTSDRDMSLSWASSIQSTPPHSTSWKSIPVLSSHLHLGLPSGLFSSCVPTKILSPPLTHSRYIPRPSHSSRFDHLHNIVWGVQIIKLLIV